MGEGPVRSIACLHLHSADPIPPEAPTPLGGPYCLLVLVRFELGQSIGYRAGTSRVLRRLAAHWAAWSARQSWTASPRHAASVRHNNAGQLVPLQGGSRAALAAFERISWPRAYRRHPLVSERLTGADGRSHAPP